MTFSLNPSMQIKHMFRRVMRRCNKTWLHPVSIKNIEAAQGLTDTSVSHVTTMRRASMTRAEEWRRGEDREAGVRAPSERGHVV